MNHASLCRMLATTLRCSSVAPLETPVVPPVYCRKAMSSPPTGHRLEHVARALRHGHVEARDRATAVKRQAELGHHLLDVAQHEVDQLALREAQHVAHRGQHHMAHVGLRDDALQRVREVLQHHDHGGTGIGQLVRQFARGVERVDVDHHAPHAQDRPDRHEVLRHVGHHHRDAIAPLDALHLQPRAQRLRTLVDLRVGEANAHAGRGVALRMRGPRLLQQRHQRRVGVHRHVARHAGRIGHQPGALRRGGGSGNGGGEGVGHGETL